MKNTERLYFLDALRILAFALLVPYHVGMYYVGWDWHVKSATLAPAIEPAMLLSSPWRLGLLFLISGAATQFLLGKTGSFLRQRSARLLWPLLFGMLVIVPPQAYFQVVTQLNYGGGYLDFMGLYLQRYHGFCKDGHCLSLPTWNHLWFVAYLWVYSLIAWALFKLWPRCAAQFEGLLKPSPWTLILLGLPLLAARLLVALFPSTHNLTWDWYNHAQYGYLFLLGLLTTRSALWELMQAWRRTALVIAVLCWLVWVAYFFTYPEGSPPVVILWGQRLVWGALEWAAIVAACGFARRHLSADSAWRRALTPAIFCVYILHQTVIVLLTRALLPLALPPLVEGPLLIALTFTLCLSGYALLRHVPVLRALLGIQR
ncbi:MAG TPA: acyltransferase family protein [Burkholderiaceae bacterium]